MTKRFIKCVRGIDDYDVWDKIKDKGLSHNDAVTLLNEQDKQIQFYRIDYGQLVLDFEELKHENEQLKKEIIGVIDRKIKNNESNPPKDFEVYSKVNRALKDVRESLRDVLEEY